MSSHQRYSIKKVFLKRRTIKKEILKQMFSCKFCKLFKSTFFIEQRCSTKVAISEDLGAVPSKSLKRIHFHKRYRNLDSL